MNGKLLGTAVSVALENREELRNISAPVVTASQGAATVIFRTIWKSIAIGAGMLVLWMVMYGTTYVLTRSTFFIHINFLMLFGVFLMVVLPAIVFTLEARRVTKDVQKKNRAYRAAVNHERQVREAQYAEARAVWEAQQAQQQMLYPEQPRQTFV